MNAELLLKHFDRIAEAPDAVARLRRFVLDLAVRGKLVEQDPEDEPAGQLLERVQVEKARLLKEGRERQGRVVSVDQEEPPFDLPESWQWSQLVQIGFLNPRNQVGDDLPVSFVPMPMISADYGVPHQHEIRSWGELKSGYTHFAEGDVGLAKITPCFENGKSTVFRHLENGIGAGTTELHIVRPVFVSGDYVLVFLKSPYFIETGIPRMTGTAGQKRVPASYFGYSPFPLPPLAEQHRIVAKVDELMALCDRLEGARNERDARRGRLVAASLHRLQTAPAAAEAEGADQAGLSLPAAANFYLDHLPLLATRVEHIKQLRQTILRLAVRGYLVHQDPSEEPSTILLQRIAEGRKTYLDAGCPNPKEATLQLRKQAAQATPAGLPGLPSGWSWATLMQCSLLVVDCHNKTAPYSPAGIPLIRTTNVRDGRLNDLDLKFVDELTYARWSARCEPAPGDIVITREAPMGEVAVIPDGMKLCLGQRMMLVRLVPNTVDAGFLIYSLRDPELMERVQDKPVGATVQHLRVGGVETLLIPLPPVSEQRRIVEKVDELMSLCDQLERRLAATASNSRRLLEAALRDALAPARSQSVELEPA